MLFDLGQLLATRASIAHLAAHNISPLDLIQRHAIGDWGDICAGDRRLNNRAIVDGHRILSAYLICGVKVYVITESDRSQTTALLASEY